MDNSLGLNDVKLKKKKAFMYAAVVTFVIASLYFVLTKDAAYKFGGAKDEVKKMSDYFKKSQKEIKTDPFADKDLIIK